VSKPDKHTPLSSEKLFKLLEDNSGKATDFDDMDDFEKEALEGFSKFSTPEKAVAMVEEVNLAVSKKVSARTSANKHKIIWFSAAASIVLLVMLSVFFLNESKKDAASNVAILDQVPSPAPQPSIAMAEEKDTMVEPAEEKKEELKQSANNALSGKKVFEQDLLNRQKAQEAKPVAELSKEPVFDETKNLEESEKVSAASGTTFAYNGKGDLDKKETEKKETSDFKKSETGTPAKPLAVAPAANTKSQAESANGYVAQVTSNNSSAPKTTAIEQNAKYDDRVVSETLADKAAKDVAVERMAKTGKAKENLPAYKTEDSEMDQEVESAYYKGGELAIKDYVLSYLQKQGATVTGKYKVKANVMTNGTLKVKLVNHLTNEVCKDCETILKKALGEMTGWTPAMWGKTASESSVDFVLSF
jgi:hypothetical protein